MTGTEIIEKIDKYVDEKTYNYAVLIDGEWGCGKTYFIKGDLKKAIEKKRKKVAYISLYGCNKIDDIREKIVWEFLKKTQKGVGENTFANEDVGEKQTKRVVLKEKSIKTSRKIFKWGLENFGHAAPLYEIILDWKKIEETVFIFDDLERCECGLNELFGFFNEIVEHLGAKVILVAYEDEITTEITPERLEQQYMVVTNDEIEWPQSNDVMRQPNKKLTIKELDSRRKMIFPTARSNEEYLRMREKLIGVTFQYDANVTKIMNNMLDAASCCDNIKTVIRRNTDYIKKRMDYYHHHNLRTVHFFLSKTEYLLNQLSAINIDSEYRGKIENYVLQTCFNCSAEFKSNCYTRVERANYDNGGENEIVLKSIVSYVEDGQFDFEIYKEDIEKLESRYRTSVDTDDPYNMLYLNWLNMTQEECGEKLESLINRLEDDRYPINMYEMIIFVVARVERLGFDKNYGSRMVKSMISNINNQNSVVELKADRFQFEIKEDYQRTLFYAEKVNEQTKGNKIRYGRKTVEEILTQENWVEWLDGLYARNKEKMIRNESIISKADAGKWVETLERSSAKTINEFIHWTESIYLSGMPQETFKSDWDTLYKMHESLQPELESDLIKRYALERVKKLIEEIYRINTGRKFNND